MSTDEILTGLGLFIVLSTDGRRTRRFAREASA